MSMNMTDQRQVQGRVKTYVFDTSALIEYHNGRGTELQELLGHQSQTDARYLFHPVALAEIATQTSPEYFARRRMTDDQRQREARRRTHLLVLLLRRKPFPHGGGIRLEPYLFEYRDHVLLAEQRRGGGIVSFESGRGAEPAMADHHFIMTAYCQLQMGEDVRLVTRDYGMKRKAEDLGIKVLFAALR